MFEGCAYMLDLKILSVIDTWARTGLSHLLSSVLVQHNIDCRGLDPAIPLVSFATISKHSCWYNSSDVSAIVQDSSRDDPHDPLRTSAIDKWTFGRSEGFS